MLKAPRNNILLFCLFLLVIVFSGNSQEGITKEQIKLNLYLLEIESEYDIKFSFADKDLANLEIAIPKYENLEEILDEIRAQTQLEINQLNNRYYTISKTKEVNICGYILNNYNELTASAATIEVLNSDVSALTDANGYFSLKAIPSESTIRIRHLGFKTKYISAEKLLSERPCSTILLSLNYQQLEEVVVYKFLTSGLAKEKDGSISLITDEFGIIPGLIEPDVLQSIQALPGIKSIDERVSDINIRGGTNDQNLILWDEIKMYQSGHFFGLISAFNPYLTGEVSIVKSGTSAAYGDGVSGIINMKSKDSIGGRLMGGAGINLINMDAYGQIPLSEKLALQFSARRSVTDFLNTPTYNQFSKRVFQDTKIQEFGNTANPEDVTSDENFYFYDFTAKVLYDISEEHKARFSFLAIHNNLDYIESQAQSGRTDKSGLNQTNLSFGGNLSSEWSNRFSSNVNAYYSRYNLDSENVINNGEQVLDQKNEVIETSIKLNTNYRISSNLGWLNGYQFTETGITNFTDVTQPPFESNIKGVVRANALYSEITYESSDSRFYARAGGRLNYLINLRYFNKFILEPRFVINYKPISDIRIEASGEFKNQTTNQIIDLEQNFLGIEKRRWMLSNEKQDTVPGNPNLPIVTSKQAALGINYDKNQWFIGLEGYFKKVEGVSTLTQGFQNQNQFNGEIGSYEVKGFEFLINHKNRFFSTWLSYTYAHNDYFFPDLNPSSFPNNLDIRHIVTFATTYTLDNLKIGLGVNYRTGKPFTEPLDGDSGLDLGTIPISINYQEPNSSRLPDYLRVDASALYDFKISTRVKGQAGISVLNVLNKQNILNTFYRVNTQDEIEKVENISLGFTPNISFRIFF